MFRMWNKAEDVIEDIVYPFFIDGDGDIVDVRTFEKVSNWTVIQINRPGGG